VIVTSDSVPDLERAMNSNKMSHNFKFIILMLEITYLFYNDGYFEGSALSYFNVLTAYHLLTFSSLELQLSKSSFAG